VNQKVSTPEEEEEEKRSHKKIPFFFLKLTPIDQICYFRW
jgi:hypothetical protein